MRTSPKRPTTESKSGAGISRPPVDEIALQLQRGRLLDRMFGIPTEPLRLGPYVIVETLGRGGLGPIYLAHDHVLGRKVAIATLLAEIGGMGPSRFVNAATPTAEVIVPDGVRVIATGEFRGTVYIVMQYVEGVTLEALAVR